MAVSVKILCFLALIATVFLQAVVGAPSVRTERGLVSKENAIPGLDLNQFRKADAEPGDLGSDGVKSDVKSRQGRQYDGGYDGGYGGGGGGGYGGYPGGGGGYGGYGGGYPIFGGYNRASAIATASASANSFGK